MWHEFCEISKCTSHFGIWGFPIDSLHTFDRCETRNLSQESWPYYQKAIMESGTGSFWSYITLEAAHSNWQQVLQATKCFGIPTKRWVGSSWVVFMRYSNAAVEWSEKHSKPIEELLDGLLYYDHNQSQNTFFGILIYLRWFSHQDIWHSDETMKMAPSFLKAGLN